MSDSEPYILFELAGALYGLRSAEVRHLELLEHLTPVPDAAPAVDGIVFSRGQVVPVLNLRARFGLPRAEPTSRTRLLFLQLPQRLVALLVDAAREFHRIPTRDIKPVHETLQGIPGNYVRGIANVRQRTVLLLDLPTILARDEAALPAPSPVASST